MLGGAGEGAAAPVWGRKQGLVKLPFDPDRTRGDPALRVELDLAGEDLLEEGYISEDTATIVELLDYIPGEAGYILRFKP